MCVKELLAVSRRGAEEKDQEAGARWGAVGGAALSAGEMEFYLDESSDRSERKMKNTIWCHVCNDKKPPATIKGERNEVKKRNPCST